MYSSYALADEPCTSPPFRAVRAWNVITLVPVLLRHAGMLVHLTLVTPTPYLVHRVSIWLARSAHAGRRSSPMCAVRSKQRKSPVGRSVASSWHAVSISVRDSAMAMPVAGARRHVARHENHGALQHNYCCCLILTQ